MGRAAPLIVVAGPSGVGKTTLVMEVLGHDPARLRRAVTATTRDPRPGEVPGSDYHYWSMPEFQRAIADNALLEYAIVHGRDYYGTPKAEVEPYRNAGRGVMLVIDVQGAATVRAGCRDCVSVFVAPPSFEELELRLLARGSETVDRVMRRLVTARQELKRQNEFDCVIINNVFSQAVQELTVVVQNQFLLHEGLSMLDDLKEEEIVNKVGGRFKLSTLIQKRMVALNTGAKPLVDVKSSDKMAVVLEEILQDKIYLDPTGEVQTQNMTVSMNLPAPYFSSGTAAPAPETPAVGGEVPADDED